MPIPIAVFCGLYDELSTVEDCRRDVDQMGDAVVHYGELEAGHQTFLVGQDASYFKETVMDLLDEYYTEARDDMEFFSTMSYELKT
jgi:hypothetical protein